MEIGEERDRTIILPWQFMQDNTDFASFLHISADRVVCIYRYTQLNHLICAGRRQNLYYPRDVGELSLSCIKPN